MNNARITLAIAGALGIVITTVIAQDWSTSPPPPRIVLIHEFGQVSSGWNDQRVWVRHWSDGSADYRVLERSSISTSPFTFHPPRWRTNLENGQIQLPDDWTLIELEEAP